VVKPISQLAKGRKEAVIIFDDLARPTPASRLVPHILEELRKAGIEGNRVRFVAAMGAHKTPTREDHAKKLGEEVPKDFCVYNHNVYDNLVDVGTTSRGTPVRINREVMECDLKIGIGGIVPHGHAGFGGGAKIILPGVSWIETIQYNHWGVGGSGPGKTLHPKAGLGKIAENPIRFDMEEAARLAGLDFKVDAVLNNRREVVGLFAGDFVAEHREGVKMAKEVYTTEPALNADLVITNGYPQEDESVKALWAANASVKEGGTVVVVAQSPEGMIHHYVRGRFGTRYGGRLFDPPTRPRVPKAKRLIIYSEYPSKRDTHWFGPSETVTWLTSWEEVLEEVKRDQGSEPRVAVYPYAAIQCPPFPENW
jgi:nickel-dependent lactate racemase